MFMVVSENHICKDVILWVCEQEHEQISPKEYFREYPIDIDEILIDT
jgi:hypothetical protein